VPPAVAGSAGSAASASADKRSEQAMVIRVHDAEKHGEGSLDAHVTYAITTQTSLPGYAAPRATVRRRYQDFAWLRTQLVREYPACIVPPMPEKHRLGMPSGAGGGGAAAPACHSPVRGGRMFCHWRTQSTWTGSTPPSLSDGGRRCSASWTGFQCTLRCKSRTTCGYSWRPRPGYAPDKYRSELLNERLT